MNLVQKLKKHTSASKVDFLTPKPTRDWLILVGAGTVLGVGVVLATAMLFWATTNEDGSEISKETIVEDTTLFIHTNTLRELYNVRTDESGRFSSEQAYLDPSQ